MDSIVANALKAYIASSMDSSRSTSASDTLPTSTMDDKTVVNTPCDDDKSCLNEVATQKRLPFKKQMVLQLKDQEIAVTEYKETVSESIEGSKPTEVSSPILTPIGKNNATKSQRVSPPCCNISLMEYQDQLKQMERFVRSACEYELRLLNEAKTVREKRNRMVYRLKCMKLRVLRRAYLCSSPTKNDSLHEYSSIEGNSSQPLPTLIDDFPFPPVFGEAPISIRRQR